MVVVHGMDIAETGRLEGWKGWKTGKLENWKGTRNSGTRQLKEGYIEIPETVFPRSCSCSTVVDGLARLASPANK